MSSEGIAAIIVAVFGALGLIVPAYLDMHAKLRQIERTAADVRSEVKNTHSVNLRDDIDHFRDEMREALDAIRTDAQLEHAELWQAITETTDLPAPDYTYKRKSKGKHG